jgi:RNA polymerase sigma-70 factor (sigma-E family)
VTLARPTGADVDLDEFVRTRAQSLLRFTRVLTGDLALAEDIVQDVLMRLHRRADQLDGIDNLDAYARRIAVHEFASWGRRWFRIRPSASVPQLDDEPDPSRQLDDRDLLSRELRELPRQQRAVLVLRYYEDLSDAEIAQVLGCSQGTVRSHASRALATLRIQIPRTAHNTIEAIT